MQEKLPEGLIQYFGPRKHNSDLPKVGISDRSIRTGPTHFHIAAI